ncbi:MAG: hypothetical protein AVDCRST_MAG86-3273 [uncultured Truepera sp.]|uniref:Sialate O-acetylesterase domain-containing protein n=1 Tax=uncultured Truepera sp. TaxID=543023 RepID=A0A6J4VVU6_9DEIN|nr:MAG: hypothetical protein AVDCRST_MAG86-3273 [uncultured Truepera sp.]
MNAGWPQAAVDFGPEMQLAYETRQRFNRPVFIIKHAVGGTRLTPTSGNTWNPDVRGSYYDALISEINSGLAAIRAAGYISVVRGFLWGQGETDAQFAATQASYEAPLTKLFNGVRTTVGDPALPIVDMLIRTETYTTGVPAINNAKAAVSTSLGTRLIKTEAMEDKGDDLHLSGRAQLAFGRHTFERALDLSYNMPAGLPPRFFELDFTRQDAYTTSALHTVSSVQDRSGNARHFTQATAADRPLFFDGAYNSFGALRGTLNKSLVGALNPVAAGGAVTLYMVITNVVTDAGNPRIYFSGGNTSSFMFIYRNGSKLLSFGNSTTSVFTASQALSIGDTHIIVVGYGGAAGSYMLINGVQVASSSTAIAFNTGVAMQIFNSPNASNGANTRNAAADVGMLGGFASQLTLANAQILTGFLAHRTRLQSLLPADHPYALNPPV